MLKKYKSKYLHYFNLGEYIAIYEDYDYFVNDIIMFVDSKVIGKFHDFLSYWYAIYSDAKIFPTDEAISIFKSLLLKLFSVVEIYYLKKLINDYNNHYIKKETISEIDNQLLHKIKLIESKFDNLNNVFYKKYIILYYKHKYKQDFK